MSKDKKGPLDQNCCPPDVIISNTKITRVANKDNSSNSSPSYAEVRITTTIKQVIVLKATILIGSMILR